MSDKELKNNFARFGGILYTEQEYGELPQL
jgi:hypothetical protein